MAIGHVDLQPARDHAEQEHGVEPVSQPDDTVIPLDGDRYRIHRLAPEWAGKTGRYVGTPWSERWFRAVILPAPPLRRAGRSPALRAPWRCARPPRWPRPRGKGSRRPAPPA